VQDSGLVAITRRAAFGDVIGATVIADEVARLGYRAKLNTLPQIVSSGIFRHHRSVTTFGNQDDPCHVNLDDTYERSPLRKIRSAMSLFYEVAAAQLVRQGIHMRPECNLRPQLTILPQEVEAARQMLSPFPRPWVAVIPRSNAWPNRTVQLEKWSSAAAMVDGTMLWTGTDRINDQVLVDMRCTDMRKLTALLAAVDLVVGVDTGPMWCAVGVNTPILGISQARPFRVLINDQSDWQDISPQLDCIGCSEHLCPINATNPPCQQISPFTLAEAINARTETVTGNKVSAVIPCLHDKDPRIPRCIEAVLPQVDEVVVSLDGAATGDSLPQHPKIRLVHSPAGQKTGFGKTCNRGARASRGRYILFLNDDLYLAPGAVRQMKMSACEQKVAIVGGLWRYPDGTIQHGGGNRGSGDVGFGHLDWKKKEATHIDPVDMEFVTAACMMVRREAFYQVGAFGEEFGNYSEDADLCMKVRQAGWRVVFNPRATGIHDESQTTKPEKLEMLKVAHGIFRQKWLRYFSHNPPGQLGVFT
jgi:GT2 family glycosyltransferase/ADP-heptose:LPS heptosyltransferase